MNVDVEDIEVQCTIWLKKLDGKWLGCLSHEGGDLLRAGKILLEKYPSRELAEALVAKRSICSIVDEAVKCVEAPAEFYPECGDSLMKMQAREHGEYCYIFDEATDKWWFGKDMKHELRDLVDYIDRNEKR